MHRVHELLQVFATLWQELGEYLFQVGGDRASVLHERIRELNIYHSVPWLPIQE